ncbi:MAG: C-GCAxxG-C-C family protein [Desulfovibrio sp.]|nr:C-GCAxxG-C-C family protein [Desulfovibrio sp.]
MHPLLLELLPSVQRGFCCSQLLIQLALRMLDRDTPELVQAARGLCYGIGQSNGPCGLLTAGACCLALLSAKGSEQVSCELMSHPLLNPMLNDYALWFAKKVHPYGGTRCDQIAGGLGGSKEHNLQPCGDLLACCWEKIVELLQAYEVEIS